MFTGRPLPEWDDGLVCIAAPCSAVGCGHTFIHVMLCVGGQVWMDPHCVWFCVFTVGQHGSCISVHQNPTQRLGFKTACTLQIMSSSKVRIWITSTVGVRLLCVAVPEAFGQQQSRLYKSKFSQFISVEKSIKHAQRLFQYSICEVDNSLVSIRHVNLWAQGQCVSYFAGGWWIKR